MAGEGSSCGPPGAVIEAEEEALSRSRNAVLVKLETDRPSRSASSLIPDLTGGTEDRPDRRFWLCRAESGLVEREAPTGIEPV